MWITLTFVGKEDQAERCQGLRLDGELYFLYHRSSRVYHQISCYLAPSLLNWSMKRFVVDYLEHDMMFGRKKCEAKCFACRALIIQSTIPMFSPAKSVHLDLGGRPKCCVAFGCVLGKMPWWCLVLVVGWYIWRGWCRVRISKEQALFVWFPVSVCCA